MSILVKGTLESIRKDKQISLRKGWLELSCKLPGKPPSHSPGQSVEG